MTLVTYSASGGCLDHNVADHSLRVCGKIFSQTHEKYFVVTRGVHITGGGLLTSAHLGRLIVAAGAGLGTYR